MHHCHCLFDITYDSRGQLLVQLTAFLSCHHCLLYLLCCHAWRINWLIDWELILWPWNWGSGSLKVIESGTIRYSTYDFVFVFYSKYASVNQWICLYLLPFPRYGCMLICLVFGAPLGVKPSDLRNNPWWRKTRIMGLSDRERISWKNFDDTFSRFDTIHVCDRQTDTGTDGRTDGSAVAYAL